MSDRKTKRLSVFPALVIALTLLCQAPAYGQGGPQQQIPFSDEAVNKAIERGVKYIWSQHRADGESPWPELRWLGEKGEYMKLRPITGSTAKDMEKQHYNYGGYTALAVYALLACGEDPQSPRMKHAIGWLMKLNCRGTYSLGVRTQIWAMLKTSKARKLLAKEARQLVRSAKYPPGNWRWKNATWATGAQYGSYDYLSNGRRSAHIGCNSNTQFANLGVWTAARHRVEINDKYWPLVYNHWITAQQPDGGWCYSNWPRATGNLIATTPNMTLAGVASLFVALDHMNTRGRVACGRQVEPPAIKRAMQWLEGRRNLANTTNGYTLYGLERVGFATGYKYIAGVDWYKTAATNLINRQEADGSWGRHLQDSYFILLFLARGRSPLMFNRLQYNGDWNNRPRALSNLTGWASYEFERETNWQIVNIDRPVSGWHDSQILLISGSKKPEFSDKQLDKLREFVHQGGTILSVAECREKGRAFDVAMREYYGKLFPRYELTQLRPDHKIYSIQYPMKRDMKISAVFNGVRILAFHTTTDMIASWQVNAWRSASKNFKLAANIHLYANEHSRGLARAARTWPEKTQQSTLRSARVARVKYSGNWDPEPGAWKRFALLMANKWRTEVTVSEPMTCEKLDAKQWPLAAITGTATLSLTKAEKTALKAYVLAGGTVLIDAAGGSKEFSAAAGKLLGELFGASSLLRLRASSPIYNLPNMKITSVKYRRASGAASDKPQLRAIMIGERPGVILSRKDLTTGLLGCPAYGCIGYASDSAVAIVRNIVLYTFPAGAADAEADTPRRPRPRRNRTPQR